MNTAVSSVKKYLSSFILMVFVTVMSSSIITQTHALGRNQRPLGWAIESNNSNYNNMGSTSTTDSYHVISASRSGFKLYNDNLAKRDDATRSHTNKRSSAFVTESAPPGTCTQLVSCTRYGQRVKKPKSHSKDHDGH